MLVSPVEKSKDVLFGKFTPTLTLEKERERARTFVSASPELQLLVLYALTHRYGLSEEVPPVGIGGKVTARTAEQLS